jgi:hypothetical protein
MGYLRKKQRSNTTCEGDERVSILPKKRGSVLPRLTSRRATRNTLSAFSAILQLIINIINGAAT